MGFNKRKMEDARRQEAEKVAASRRATDRQILEDAEAVVTGWNERQVLRGSKACEPLPEPARPFARCLLRQRSPQLEIALSRFQRLLPAARASAAGRANAAAWHRGIARGILGFPLRSSHPCRRLCYADEV